MEKRYDFKRRMLEVHVPGRKNDSVWTKISGIVLDDTWEIVYSRSAGRVLAYVAHDLTEYFNVSLDIFPHLRACDDITSARAPGKIVLATAEDFPDLAPVDSDSVDNPRAKALAYHIIASDGGVIVIGASERGTAQGSYALERIMNANEGPVIQERDETVTALFSPRMTHSGYELDTFPDNVLKAIAHEGMDAIKVFTKGVHMTEHGYQDMNELIWRAEGFGLDVYCYSYYKSQMHPGDPGAAEYYDSLYGELFRAVPGFRGVIFVGESIAFPSHDPHTSWDRKFTGLNLYHPGWYPCYDYPEWINMVSGVIHRYSPNCEIVFWTYNWGFHPAEARLALIRSLPTDITLLVTYEMFELRDVAPGVVEKCADYTLGFEGPGHYFQTEAEVAHERGIRLYAMSNTGGLTWDVGDVPYLPVPQQWNRRWQGVIKAHDEWGLCGLMESHHYGFVPSFVSELANLLYSRVNGVSPDFDTAVRAIAARDFGSENAETVVKAWNLWSEGLRHVATEAYDQYGPLRIGPSYPLTFTQAEAMPPEPYASHDIKNPIVAVTYFQDVRNNAKYLWELHSMEEMERLFREGCDLIESIPDTLPEPKRTAARRELALGRFIQYTAQTYVANKRWHLLKSILLNSTGECALEPNIIVFFRDGETEAPPMPMPEGESHDRALLLPEVGLAADASDTDIAAEMERIALNEIENARRTIPVVLEDSRIGFEPTMDYTADEIRLNWKIGVTRDSIGRLHDYMRNL